MKIAIISLVIFPQKSPRSYRATELAKYFAKKGHEVYLYASLGQFDYKMFEQKYGITVCSLGHMHFCTLNSDGGYVRDTIFNKALKRLFGNVLEYPYIELVWKVKKVVSKMRGVDLLITIAMPHPIHWGAAWAKKKNHNTFPKVWVSDCGDPYMGNQVGSKHPFYFRKIEDFWGRMTDNITIPIEEGRKAYSETVQSKIRVIPQGFDFTNVHLDLPFKEDEFVKFAYAGAIYPVYRDPSKLLDYLVTLTDKKFQFTVYTKNKEWFSRYKTSLGDKLILKDYVDRDKLIYELSQMNFLVNMLNSGSVQAPSKLIDYYLTKRPIIDISSSFNEKVYFDEFLDGNYKNRHKTIDISQFDINNVGQQFLYLVN